MVDFWILQDEISTYTPREKTQIVSVIRRDEILRIQHRLNILRLKGELQAVRRKGALFGNSNNGGAGSVGGVTGGSTAAYSPGGAPGGSSGRRRCGRCRGELGRIINRGLCCPGCRLRVCKSCRQYLEHSLSVQWLCTLCQYHLEEKSASGDWMKEFVKETNKEGNATENIKRSIQRSLTFSDVSPSPWCYLRGSPEMRAYSSMPRHQDCEFIYTPDFTKLIPKTFSDEQSVRQQPLKQQDKEAKVKARDVDEEEEQEVIISEAEVAATAEDEEPVLAIQPISQRMGEVTECSDDSNHLPEEDSNENRSLMRPQYSSPSPGAPSSPALSQQRDPTPSPTAQLFRKVALRIDARNLPPACDDASICSEPIGGRAAEEEVDRLINHHRATALGARSDSLASVYSGAGEGRHIGVPVKGEVQFGLQYNYKQSSLEIHVKQCKDLAPVDIKRNRSDPYVKVYLLPDKSKSGKRKTRVKKHTLNPIFDEVLKFQVSLEGLEHRTLWLSVWHSDMFGRNDFLGEVLMPLENKVFDDPNYKFYTLQERSEMVEELNCRGELIVGLKYETPDENSQTKKRPSKGCLYVLIKEAKNLPAVKSNGTSDPFCKSYLLPDKGRSSKQKAPVIRKTCNPSWHHTFTYHNVSLDELSERSLELTIWDHDRLASNEFLGGVRLNTGTGKHQGKLVDWMDASGNEVTLWQRMIEKPNFWVESCLPLRPSLDLRTNP